LAICQVKIIHANFVGQINSRQPQHQTDLRFRRANILSTGTNFHFEKTSERAARDVVPPPSLPALRGEKGQGMSGVKPWRVNPLVSERSFGYRVGWTGNDVHHWKMKIGDR